MCTTAVQEKRGPQQPAGAPPRPGVSQGLQDPLGGQRLSDPLCDPLAGQDANGGDVGSNAAVQYYLPQQQCPPNTCCATPTDDETVDKSAAKANLLRWNGLAPAFYHAEQGWLTDNHSKYLGRTYRSPQLGWTSSMYKTVGLTALGELTSAGGKSLAAAGAAKAGGSVASLLLAGGAGATAGSALPGLGTVSGFIIGVLVEAAGSIVIDQLTGSETEKALTQAGVVLSDMVRQKSGEVHDATGKKLKEHATAFAVVSKALDAATSQQEVDEINNGVQAEVEQVSRPVPRSDDTLYKKKLKDWVLEHAGDEEDANKDTSEDQWEKNRGEVFGRGLDTAEKRQDNPHCLDGRPDLLAGHHEICGYQSRLHWKKAGLKGLPHAKDMIATAEAIAKGEGGAMDPDEAMMKAFDGKKISLDKGVDVKNFREFLKAEVSRRTYWAAHESLLDEAMEQVEKDKGTIECTLDLTTSDGACYVDEWEYDISIPHDSHENPAPKPMNAKFEVSPD